MKVLETQDKWIGITYKEDTELAQAGFREMIRSGKYPAKLWDWFWENKRENDKASGENRKIWEVPESDFNLVLFQLRG